MTAASPAHGAVTPDGCPVEVYRRLPTAGEPELVHAAVAPGADVLDLGCGTGRIAGPLAALGHRVVGVDESAEMLARLGPAVTPARARIEELDLGERFGAVLMASHLVNTADAARRAAMLASASRHLLTDGVLVAQWHPPGWFDGLRAGDRRRGRLGDVDTEFEVLGLTPDLLEGAVRYALDRRRWEQRFRAARLAVHDLDAALAAAGLRRDAWLTADESWFAARPA